MKERKRVLNWIVFLLTMRVYIILYYISKVKQLQFLSKNKHMQEYTSPISLDSIADRMKEIEPEELLYTRNI